MLFLILRLFLNPGRNKAMKTVKNTGLFWNSKIYGFTDIELRRI